MKRRRVEISDDARTDLFEIYSWIEDAAGAAVALRYIARLQCYLEGFDVASERGTRRDDVRPGLRVVGFERRIAVAILVEEERGDYSAFVFMVGRIGQPRFDD